MPHFRRACAKIFSFLQKSASHMTGRPMEKLLGEFRPNLGAGWGVEVGETGG